MHKFETFDCGLIKGQSFSEYKCDLTFIFLNTYQEKFILIKIIKHYYIFCSRTIFFWDLLSMLLSILAVEQFCWNSGSNSNSEKNCPVHYSYWGGTLCGKCKACIILVFFKSTTQANTEKISIVCFRWIEVIYINGISWVLFNSRRSW